MKVIAGLGNPEEQYKNTRHNLGFMLIDAWEKKHRTLKVEMHITETGNRILVASSKVNGIEVLTLKPAVGMNSSGLPIKEILKTLEISTSDLIVAYDDMDFKLGTFKVKQSGKDAGHNGIKSIINNLDENFIRVRLGIGKAPNRDKTLDWVLGNFTSEENILVDEVIEKAIESIEYMFANGIDKAMNKYNSK